MKFQISKYCRQFQGATRVWLVSVLIEQPVQLNQNRLRLIFFLFLCLLCCNGCWDRKELKTQGLVAGMGVDLVTGGSTTKYLYTFQVIKPGEVAQPKGKGSGGSSGGAPV
ncbi:MAG TPA: hypothetical protein DDW65_22675 [Firmicutes bacterium]|jgi:hypothetical protein|nr:hypothetical protein [Bacillota bacterium]